MDYSKITEEQLTREITAILADEHRIKRYQIKGETYISGTFGVMSPESRPAFVEKFGEQRIIKAENEAQKVLAADCDKWYNSVYYRASLEADDHASDENWHPRKGDRCWGVGSTLVQEHGLPGAVLDLVRIERDNAEKEPYNRCEITPVLCEITDVVPVSSEEFEAEDTADIVARSWHIKGGTVNYDHNTVFVKDRPTYIQQCAAIVAPDGCWHLIDPEGSGYAHYIYLPTTWREMLAGLTEKADKDLADKEAEEERKEHAAQAKRAAEYKARCDAWSSIMTPIESYQKAVGEAVKNYGYDSKERKAAERELAKVSRSNIAAMCADAFPKVKFSVCKSKDYHTSWEITWTDGPTKAVFNEAADIALFIDNHYTHDPYADYGDYEKNEFTEFAEKYMGNGLRDDITLNREISDFVLKQILSIVQAVVNDWSAPHVFTNEEIYRLNDLIKQKLNKEASCSFLTRGFPDYRTPQEAAAKIARNINL